MTKKTPVKKADQQDRPAVPVDWHWKDILTALHKAGWSLRQLGIVHGYDDGAPLGEAARRPFPKAERIIANAIGIEPQELWPTRYDNSGQPNRRRGPAPRRPASFCVNRIPITHIRNPQAARSK